MALNRAEQPITKSNDMYYYLSTSALGVGLIFYPFFKDAVLFDIIDINTVMIVVGLYHTIYALTQYLDARNSGKRTQVRILEHQDIEDSSAVKEDCNNNKESECYAIHISNDQKSKQPLKVDVYELSPICQKDEKESVLELLPIREQFEGITISRTKH